MYYKSDFMVDAYIRFMRVIICIVTIDSLFRIF